jgi:hypothetical protein
VRGWAGLGSSGYGTYLLCRERREGEGRRREKERTRVGQLDGARYHYAQVFVQTSE